MLTDIVAQVYNELTRENAHGVPAIVGAPSEPLRSHDNQNYFGHHKVQYPLRSARGELCYVSGGLCRPRPRFDKIVPWLVLNRVRYDTHNKKKRKTDRYDFDIGYMEAFGQSQHKKHGAVIREGVEGKTTSV